MPSWLIVPADIDLADARIRGYRIDAQARRVTIEVALAEPSAQRSALLLFEGIRSAERVAETLKLAARPGAATILHWKPSPGPGNTFLYLMDGVVSIWAERLTMETRPDDE